MEIKCILIEHLKAFHAVKDHQKMLLMVLMMLMMTFDNLAVTISMNEKSVYTYL